MNIVDAVATYNTATLWAAHDHAGDVDIPHYFLSLLTLGSATTRALAACHTSPAQAARAARLDPPITYGITTRQNLTRGRSSTTLERALNRLSRPMAEHDVLTILIAQQTRQIEDTLESCGIDVDHFIALTAAHSSTRVTNSPADRAPFGARTIVGTMTLTRFVGADPATVHDVLSNPDVARATRHADRVVVPDDHTVTWRREASSWSSRTPALLTHTRFGLSPTQHGTDVTLTYSWSYASAAGRLLLPGHRKIMPITITDAMHDIGLATLNAHSAEHATVGA